MVQDVERHCEECTVCQQTKPTMPTRVQMTNAPIGRPWQMIAMDILEVTVSSNNNKGKSITNIQKSDSLKRMIQSGGLHQLLGSWTHDGKETG